MSTRRLPRTGRARDGFTLLEVTIAFLILALAAAVAVPAWRALFEEDELTAATNRIESLFKLARDSAIRSGLPVTVVIDSVTGHVWLDSPPRVLPADTAPSQRLVMTQTLRAAPDTGQSIGLPPGVRIALTRARAMFQFTPGGGVFADSLVLETRLGNRLITLDPWTGDVIAR